MRDTYLPKFYLMDPENEDIIDADELEDGMVVMLEHPEARVEVNNGNELSPEMAHKAMMYNRFCTVTKLKKIGETTFNFVGVYDGGVKMSRSTTSNVSWIVKNHRSPCAD